MALAACSGLAAASCTAASPACRARALPPTLAGDATRVGRVLIRVDAKGRGEVIAESEGKQVARELLVTDFPSLRKVLLQAASWGTCEIGGDAYTFEEHATEPKIQSPPLEWSLLAVRFGGS